MVKRPATGLLANQWEFPNVCVRVSDEKTKSAPKMPGKKERERTLTEFLLEDLFRNHSTEEVKDAVSGLKRASNGDPMEHIFSHVKHVMWIEVGHLSINFDELSKNWTTSSGQECRWMTESDMEEVGITSGVKKVLKSVQSQLSKSTSKKRKR
jgi:adenine-specific DNA glycosylase